MECAQRTRGNILCFFQYPYGSLQRLKLGVHRWVPLFGVLTRSLSPWSVTQLRCMAQDGHLVATGRLERPVPSAYWNQKLVARPGPSPSVSKRQLLAGQEARRADFCGRCPVEERSD